MRVRTPPPCRSPCSRLRPRCACPSGKLHSASAPQRTPCSLCRRNSSFPAVQWMRWGACAPWKQGVQALVHTVTAISCAGQGKLTPRPVITRADGAGRRSHIAAARRRKRVRRFKNTAGLYAAKSLNTAVYLTVNNRHVNRRALISKKLHRNGAVKKAACERIRMRTGFWCTCLRVFCQFRAFRLF